MKNKKTVALLVVTVLLFLSGCSLMSLEKRASTKVIETEEGTFLVAIPESWTLDTEQEDITIALETKSDNSYIGIQISDQKDYTDLNAYMEDRLQFMIETYGEPKKEETVETEYGSGERIYIDLVREGIKMTAICEVVPDKTTYIRKWSLTRVSKLDELETEIIEIFESVTEK